MLKLDDDFFLEKVNRSQYHSRHHAVDGSALHRVTEIVDDDTEEDGVQFHIRCEFWHFHCFCTDFIALIS